MSNQDPFYLVKDDIQGSVSCRVFGKCAFRGLLGWAATLQVQPLLDLCFGLVQLDKAQNKYSKWQSLSKGNAEKRKLEVDIEDECKSITWQVRR